MTIYANSIVSENELKEVFEQMTQKSKGTELNPYEVYIQGCKENEPAKVDSEGKRLVGIEKHHITPRFDGGADEPDNLVLLTVKEHVIAHWLRWKVLGQRGDYIAFLWRIGDTEEALVQRREAVLEARKRDKINKKGFFNSEFQREMGTRGGAAGGSRNTAAQFSARQQVGQKFGRRTGMKNQGEDLIAFLSNFSIWSYSRQAAEQKRGASRSDEVFFLVSPKKAFVDVAMTLELFVPESIESVSTMHKLTYKLGNKNRRNQMYGWKIVETLTRSEVREGIETFKKNNPLVSFSTEEDNNIFE